MLTKLGQTTKTLFIKGPESHKLHHEFEVAEGAEIFRGQQVTLNEDGQVVPVTFTVDEVTEAITTTPKYKIIGVSIHNGKAGEMVTIAMVAYVIIYAEVEDELDAGPVRYKGMSATDDGNEVHPIYVSAPDAATTTGWALDKGEEAGDIVRVALF